MRSVTAAACLILALWPLAGFATSPQDGGFDDLLQRAASAAAEQRHEDAIGLYGDAVRLRPDSPEALWPLSSLLYGDERFVEAAQHLDHLLSVEPDSGRALALRGLCDVRLGDYEAALGRLQNAFRLGMESQSLLVATALHIALLVNKLGNPDAALQLLASFAQAGDDRTPVILAHGLALLRRPKLLEEIEDAERPMLLLAGRGAYHMARGRRTAIGRLALEELATRYPTEPGVHYAYGLYVAPEFPDLARRELERELEIDPDHYPAILQLGSMELRRENYELALELADRAQALAPDSPAVRLLKGRALLGSGAAEEAISELEAGSAMAPESPDFYFSLGQAYRRAGLGEQALEAEEAFRRLNQARGGSDPGSEPGAAGPNEAPSAPQRIRKE